MTHFRIFMVVFVAVLVSRNLCAETEGMIEKGKKVFANHCDMCHGKGKGGALEMLQKKYQGGVPAALEERTDMDFNMIKSFVRGQPGTMLAFRPTAVTDEDLEALAAYLTRNNKKKK